MAIQPQPWTSQMEPCWPGSPWSTVHFQSPTATPNIVVLFIFCWLFGSKQWLLPREHGSWSGVKVIPSLAEQSLFHGQGKSSAVLILREWRGVLTNIQTISQWAPFLNILCSIKSYHIHASHRSKLHYQISPYFERINYPLEVSTIFWCRPGEL